MSYELQIQHSSKYVLADIGSGIGKALATAWGLWSYNICGIEIDVAKVEKTCELMTRMQDGIK